MILCGLSLFSDGFQLFFNGFWLIFDCWKDFPSSAIRWGQMMYVCMHVGLSVHVHVCTYVICKSVSLIAENRKGEPSMLHRCDEKSAIEE